MMGFDHWALRPARLLHDHLLAALRQSPTFAHRLFGVRLPPPESGDALWDYTTLVLCKASRRYVRGGMRVWDLGCGSSAVLSLYAARRQSIEVVASDRDSECVRAARRVVVSAGLTGRVHVVESDLGERVDGSFDVVLFNAPYLPLRDRASWSTARPRAAEEAARYQRRYAGGEDGLATIRRFLHQAPRHLRRGGSVLVGFNRLYVPLAELASAARDTPMRHVGQIFSAGNPSCVAVLEQCA